MPTIISGSGSADFNTPLPVAEGGTGASTSIGSGGVMLSGQTGSAPVFGARAWCVFDGTLTGTNAPIAGGNVTSVTRNSTGNYTVNFTTAMPDALFSTNITVQPTGPTDFSTNPRVGYVQSKTTASVNISTGGAPTGSTLDMTQVNIAIFR